MNNLFMDESNRVLIHKNYLLGLKTCHITKLVLLNHNVIISAMYQTMHDELYNCYCRTLLKRGLFRVAFPQWF